MDARIVYKSFFTTLAAINLPMVALIETARTRAANKMIRSSGNTQPFGRCLLAGNAAEQETNRGDNDTANRHEYRFAFDFVLALTGFSLVKVRFGSFP
jgi:hypothetical protein